MAMAFVASAPGAAPGAQVASHGVAVFTHELQMRTEAEVLWSCSRHKRSVCSNYSFRCVTTSM